ncbi:stage II sporulation protein M [Haloterrigena salinisoli]|uniref:stage II sporulation protein M n=1 Tax=Haloterrigena salinisoli TaxID=3132747 RepID=UPI0030D394CB
MSGSDDDRAGRTDATTDRGERPPSDRRDEPRTDRPPVDPQDDRERDASSPEPNRGGGTEPPDSPAGPGSRRNRVWAALLLSLAVVAVGTAGTIFVAHDAPTAAAGAAVLGVGLGAAGLVGRTIAPSLLGRLDDAWAEHRPYVWFSAALFALGIGIGVALYAAGVDLTELLLEVITEDLGEGELPGGGVDPGGGIPFEPTASFFIANNTPAFLFAIGGALTLGIATLLIMVFNGLLIGNVAAVLGAETGPLVILALIGPHGIFELPALFIAAGVGFRFVHRVGQRLVGSRDALFTKAYLLRTTVFVVFGWLLLVLAAFVEAYVTLLIADALVPM